MLYEVRMHLFFPLSPRQTRNRISDEICSSNTLYSAISPISKPVRTYKVNCICFFTSYIGASTAVVPGPVAAAAGATAAKQFLAIPSLSLCFLRGSRSPQQSS